MLRTAPTAVGFFGAHFLRRCSKLGWWHALGTERMVTLKERGRGWCERCGGGCSPARRFPAPVSITPARRPGECADLRWALLREHYNERSMFDIGTDYTRRQIHEALGGSVQSYLPTA